jgi:hypothetical protein
MEVSLIDDGWFLSSSTEVGIISASRFSPINGIVSVSDVQILQEASSFLKFRLRYSAHSDIDEAFNSSHFTVESNHIKITYPNPFVPSLIADSSDLEPAFPDSLTVHLVDGAGNDLQMSTADITVDLRLGSSSSSSSSLACCGKSATLMSSGSRVSGSSFKFPSKSGVCSIQDVVPVHVAGEDYFFRFNYLGVYVDSACFMISPRHLVVNVQPGGHGVSIDQIVSGHSSPSVGDGAARDCVIGRYPSVQFWGNNSISGVYQYSNQPSLLRVTATLMNISWFNGCVLKSTSGTGRQPMVSGGLHVFNTLLITGCVQESLLLKFQAGAASAVVEVLSAAFDVFEAPNVASITEVVSLGPLGFRLNFTLPVIDRLHPLSGFIISVGECTGHCSLLHDYSDGFDSNNAACASTCNAQNIQTLMSLQDTYSFDDFWGGPTSAQTAIGSPWPICNNDLLQSMCVYPAPHNSHVSIYFRSSGRRSIIGSMVCNQAYSDWASYSESSLLFVENKLYQFQIIAYNAKYTSSQLYSGFARALMPYTGPLFMTMALPTASNVWQFYATANRPSTAVPRRGFLLDISTSPEFIGDVQSMFFFDRHNGNPNNFQKFVPSIASVHQREMASYAVSSQEDLSSALFVVVSGQTPLVASQPQFRRGWDIPYINQNVTLQPNKRYYARAYFVNNAGLGPGMGASVASGTTYSLEVSSVSPSDLDPRGGTIVSLLGLGLGVPDLHEQIIVRIGSSSCNGVQVFGFVGSPLLCRAAAGPAGAALDIFISIGNVSAGGYTLVASNAFSHSGAIVSRLQPSIIVPNTRGTVVTVFGFYFGTNQGLFSAWVTAVEGGGRFPCINSSFISDFTVLCTLSHLLNVAGHIHIKVGNFISKQSSGSLLRIIGEPKGSSGSGTKPLYEENCRRFDDSVAASNACYDCCFPMCIEEHTNAEIGPDGGAPVTCRVVSNWQFWFCF